MSHSFWHPVSQGASSEMESYVSEEIGIRHPDWTLTHWVASWVNLPVSSCPFHTVVRNKPKASGMLSKHLSLMLYLQPPNKFWHHLGPKDWTQANRQYSNHIYVLLTGLQINSDSKKIRLENLSGHISICSFSLWNILGLECNIF